MYAMHKLFDIRVHTLYSNVGMLVATIFDAPTPVKFANCLKKESS